MSDVNANYSPASINMLAQVKEWLAVDDPQHSQAKLAKGCNMPPGTLAGVVAGTYPSNPEKQLLAMMEYISRHKERMLDIAALPFVETSVYRIVRQVCRKAHKNKDFGIVSAAIGVGKTLAATQYANNNRNVLLVHGLPRMNATSMLRALVDLSNAPSTGKGSSRYGNKVDMMDALVRKLSGTDVLVVLDEADKVNEDCLEYLRRISDIAEVGVVLMGNERLHQLVGSVNGRHGQISSRIGYWPPLVKEITKADARKIVDATFSYAVPPAVHAEFFAYCGGTARVVNKLLREIIQLRRRDENMLLDTTLVSRAAEELLGLTRRVGK